LREEEALSGGSLETGPIRFGDDWPGVFIRGDDALLFAALLDRLLSERDVAEFEGSPKLDELRKLLKRAHTRC